MSSQLGRITNAERLLLNRRRGGETQKWVAEACGVSLDRYGAWERGHDAPGSSPLGRIQSHERCLLYRRRVGFTQAHVARELGVSRWWLNQMERGDAPCHELLWYWEQ